MEKLKRAKVQKSTKQINSTKVMPNFVANCTSHVSNIASCNHINIWFINMYIDGSGIFRQELCFNTKLLFYNIQSVDVCM